MLPRWPTVFASCARVAMAGLMERAINALCQATSARRQNTSIVVMRFAETLPDDLYRVRSDAKPYRLKVWSPLGTRGRQAGHHVLAVPTACLQLPTEARCSGHCRCATASATQSRWPAWHTTKQDSRLTSTTMISIQTFATSPNFYQLIYTANQFSQTMTCASSYRTTVKYEPATDMAGVDLLCEY